MSEHRVGPRRDVVTPHGQAWPARSGSGRPLLQGGFDIAIVWKLVGLQLGVDFRAVDADLKASVAERDQGQAADVLLVLVQQVFRQTDGFGFIASSRAVFDPNVHTRLLVG